MSQMTAGARLAPRPQRMPAPQRRALRVIRGTVDRPRGGVFAAICLALLVGGFLLVLLLNASMAKGSFVLDDLQTRSGDLTDQQDGLSAAIDAQSAPAALAQRALKLGMVPSTTAAFLDLADGKVLGVARAAQRVPGFTVITSPTPVYPPEAKTTVTTKGSVTTTTVVTPKENGVVQTVATSVDSKTHDTVVVTTVMTPDPTDPNVTRTVRTTVDSAKRTTTIETIVATKASGATPASTITTRTTQPTRSSDPGVKDLQKAEEEQAAADKAAAGRHGQTTGTSAKPSTPATGTRQTSR